MGGHRAPAAQGGVIDRLRHRETGVPLAYVYYSELIIKKGKGVGPNIVSRCRMRAEALGETQGRPLGSDRYVKDGQPIRVP